MFLRKLKAELPYDLVIPYIETVYIYMWNIYLCVEYIYVCVGIHVYIHTHTYIKIKSVSGRHILISMFIATTLKIAKIESNHECPSTDERFEKEKVVKCR